MIPVLADARERKRFIKFLVVGLIGTCVDFGVMNILTHFFAVSLTFAGSISFICAVLSNFTWNRFWTYPDSRSRPIARQLSMFFIVNVVGILIRIPILHFGEMLLSNIFIQAAPDTDVGLLSNNATLGLAIGIVLLWNYLANRYWTYNDVDEVKQ